MLEIVLFLSVCVSQIGGPPICVLRAQNIHSAVTTFRMRAVSLRSSLAARRVQRTGGPCCDACRIHSRAAFHSSAAAPFLFLSPHSTTRETINLGETDISYVDLNRVLDQLRVEFLGQEYHLLARYGFLCLSARQFSPCHFCLHQPVSTSY